MTTTVRPYRHPDDFDPVGRFLMHTYRTGTGHRNWLQPRWEYMVFHPMLDQQTLSEIGVWEDAGEIVASPPPTASNPSTATRHHIKRHNHGSGNPLAHPQAWLTRALEFPIHLVCPGR